MMHFILFRLIPLLIQVSSSNVSSLNIRRRAASAHDTKTVNKQVRFSNQVNTLPLPIPPDTFDKFIKCTNTSESSEESNKTSESTAPTISPTAQSPEIDYSILENLRAQGLDIGPQVNTGSFKDIAQEQADHNSIFKGKRDRLQGAHRTTGSNHNAAAALDSDSANTTNPTPSLLSKLTQCINPISRQTKSTKCKQGPSKFHPIQSFHAYRAKRRAYHLEKEVKDDILTTNDKLLDSIPLSDPFSQENRFRIWRNSHLYEAQVDRNKSQTREIGEASAASAASRSSDSPDSVSPSVVYRYIGDPLSAEDQLIEELRAAGLLENRRGAGRSLGCSSRTRSSSRKGNRFNNNRTSESASSAVSDSDDIDESNDVDLRAAKDYEISWGLSKEDMADYVRANEGRGKIDKNLASDEEIRLEKYLNRDDDAGRSLGLEGDLTSRSTIIGRVESLTDKRPESFTDVNPKTITSKSSSTSDSIRDKKVHLIEHNNQLQILHTNTTSYNFTDQYLNSFGTASTCSGFTSPVTNLSPVITSVTPSETTPGHDNVDKGEADSELPSDTVMLETSLGSLNLG